MRLPFRHIEDLALDITHHQLGIAMLLNEFLKEHARVAKLEATVAHQQRRIEELTAGLQKVSSTMEMSKAAPNVVSK